MSLGNIKKNYWLIIGGRILRRLNSTCSRLCLKHLSAYEYYQLINEQNNKEMKVETTKERILEAAKGCSDAKHVLKTLFPEVFEDDEYFDLSYLPILPFTEEEAIRAGFLGDNFFMVRKSGEYENKGFILGNRYNWKIVVDKYGYLVLLPTKK